MRDMKPSESQLQAIETLIRPYLARPGEYYPPLSPQDCVDSIKAIEEYFRKTVCDLTTTLDYVNQTPWPVCWTITRVEGWHEDEVR